MTGLSVFILLATVSISRGDAATKTAMQFGEVQHRTVAGLDMNYVSTVNLAGAKERETEVHMTGSSFFGPTVVTGDPGGQIVVGLHNDDVVAHTFTIPGVVDQIVRPGKEIEVPITLPAKGDGLLFSCRFHASQGMRGVLGNPTAVPAT